MTDKPNYSLKDLLNELKEKEKGCGKSYVIHSKILCGEVKITESYMATRLTKNTKKYYCETCQAEISALKSGISVATKLIEDEIEFLENLPTKCFISKQVEDRIKYLRGLLVENSK